MPDLALTALAESQLHEGRHQGCRGEFPMTIWSAQPRADFNYLSGYALLHLAAALELCGVGLDAEQGNRVREILNCGRDLPAEYQGVSGYNNWYRPTPGGDHAPLEYDWPGGVVLSIRDDLDDTAISALLCAMGGCRSRVPYAAEQFARYVTHPGAALRETSTERLALAGVQWGVYMSWVLDGDDAPPTPRRVVVPLENSVELISVSHVHTAVQRLGPRASQEAQRVSATFVNGMLRLAMAALLQGDTTAMERAARYYPRVPFSPISFVLRCHALTGGCLLDDQTLQCIAQCLRRIGPAVSTSPSPVAAPLYWLVAAGYAVRMGLLHTRELCASPPDVLDGLAQSVLEPQLGIPDFVFFQDAHVGHYGGRPYANAVLLEACALARMNGFV